MRKNNSPKAPSKPKPKAKMAGHTAITTKSPAATAGEDGAVADKSTHKKVGAAEFFRLTRAEIGRITWPSRKETTMTTVMVFVMVTILSLFFFLVDQILSYGIKVLLG
ncbi:MAG: preprotein translocase subunit SecE [Alphaproteobacteria bacterium]